MSEEGKGLDKDLMDTALDVAREIIPTRRTDGPWTAHDLHIAFAVTLASQAQKVRDERNETETP